MRQVFRTGAGVLLEYEREFLALSRNARLYLCAEALSAVATGAFLATYNLYILAAGHDPRLLGVLLSVAGIGAGVGAVLVGPLVDRIGARRVLLAGSLVAAGGILAQLANTRAATLLAGSAITGFGAAGFYVATAPFLAHNSAPARRTYLFSLDTAVVLAFTAVGSAAGGQIATALAALASPPFAEALAAAAGVGAAAQPYWLTLAGASVVGAASFLPLALTSASGTARDNLPEQVATAPGAAADILRDPAPPIAAPVDAGWRAVLNDPVACRLAVIAGLIGCGAGLFLPYLNVFFVRELGASPAVFGWLNAAALGCRLVGTAAAPRLAARVGPVRAVGWTQLASIPLLLTLGFAPLPLVASAAYLLRGALMNMAVPVQASFTMSILPSSSRGRGNSLIWLADSLARAASTLVGGALIAVAGYRWPYMLTAALYAAAATLFLRWFSSASVTRPQGT